MANLQDRVAGLEADNAALRRDIARLMTDMQAGRVDASLTQDLIAHLQVQANQTDQKLVDDILKESSREKENLQHEIRDLKRKLDEERRRGYDYSSAEQLRRVQGQLDTVRRENRELEYQLNEERRKKDELERRLDNPQESSRIRALDSQIEYLKQDNWKLKERIREETRDKEEWRNKYEQAVHYRPDQAALDDLRRRISALNQEKFTLSEDWKRERESFQRRIRQFEDDLRGKTAEVENVHLLRSDYEKFKEWYHQERAEKENLQKILNQQQHTQSENVALKEHVAKLEKQLMELNVSRGTRQSDLESENTVLKMKLDLEEKRAKDQYREITDMAHSIKTLENEKAVTETKFQTVLLEKKEIERKYSQTQQQQPQFNGDTTEEVKKLRDQVQTLQAQLYHRQRPAANNEHLTAEIQRLEGENKVLRKQCDEYIEETRQLRERSTSFFKSEHPSSENEYLTRTIENMKRDYDRLKERCQLVEEESEKHWRRAEENKRKYDETFQKMRNQKKSFSEERQMLEREKERVVIENSWLNEELRKAKSEAAAQPNLDKSPKLRRATISDADGLSSLTDNGSAQKPELKNKSRVRFNSECQPIYSYSYKMELEERRRKLQNEVDYFREDSSGN